MDKPYIFLSYSHDDGEIVEKIQARIEEAGFECWVDQYGIRAAENYNRAIDLAIDDCVVFLAFLSRSYLEKYYCEHEFNRAIDKQKSIMAVCLDNVGENTNQNKSYMFSFCAGYEILGYGSGIESGGQNFDAFCRDIIGSVTFEQLSRYYISGEDNDLPPILPSDFILAQLRQYNDKQYRRSGNYILDEICADLFPAVRDIELNIDYWDDEKKNVSLIKYLSDVLSCEKKHIFLVGEGGMGKTVTLLKTCEYLLNKHKCAVYIPMALLNSERTFERYLKEYVCGGNNWIFDKLKAFMESPFSGEPNIVVLLDGINETVQNEYLTELLKIEIKDKFIENNKGVQFILSSRFDSRAVYGLADSFSLLEMQPLDRQKVTDYLLKCGLPPIRDEKIAAILRTPLLLTLYADVEKYREEYQKNEGIQLVENPDTAGKILGNFFQTQLFRAAKEVRFSRADHLVLLEFFLPLIAYRMIENESFFLSVNEGWECIDEISESGLRFNWYKKDHLRKVLRGRGHFDLNNAERLFQLAEDALHFLHEVEGEYEFLHQTFRDYFAAYYIANEMWALSSADARKKELDPLISSRKFSDDVISFISDITHEENACPIMEERGWKFPGKTSVAPSTESAAEKLLYLWRDEEGEAARTAVYNLLNIMRRGRRNVLARCDFSGLDLRSCSMNLCRFVEWYRDELYPSKFDGAWMNRNFFLTNGHDAIVTAVCTDGRSLIFSGDQHGAIKFYDYNKRVWVDSFQLHNSAVVDLAWEETNQYLAVLYQKVLFVYSLNERKVKYSCGNGSRSKEYRYVKFTPEGNVLLSYDLEPLLWYTVDGEKVESALEYDVPAKCAKWHPNKKEVVRGYLLQMISVDVWNENTGRWQQHPVLLQRRDDLNRERLRKNEKPLPKVYLTLRDFGVMSGSGVNGICYHPNGNFFLVAIQNILMEFDSSTLALVRKKVFSGNVRSVCYGNGVIVAGVSSNVVILEEDFTELINLRGSQVKSIVSVSKNPNGEGYYLVSSNGEIKMLDQKLRVRRVRKTQNKYKFVWARDRLTKEQQMCFLPLGDYQNGLRYSFETNRFEHLGWRYEFLDLGMMDIADNRHRYVLDTDLMVIGTEPPYDKLIYSNYGGIWIFGCSFRDMKGDISDHNNLQFLKQNGGVVNG